jgi:hypothetical protein
MGKEMLMRRGNRLVVSEGRVAVEVQAPRWYPVVHDPVPWPKGVDASAVLSELSWNSHSTLNSKGDVELISISEILLLSPRVVVTGCSPNIIRRGWSRYSSTVSKESCFGGNSESPLCSDGMGLSLLLDVQSEESH